MCDGIDRATDRNRATFIKPDIDALHFGVIHVLHFSHATTRLRVQSVGSCFEAAEE